MDRIVVPEVAHSSTNAQGRLDLNASHCSCCTSFVLIGLYLKIHISEIRILPLIPDDMSVHSATFCLSGTPKSGASYTDSILNLMKYSNPDVNAPFP